jgi:hypothetical protein
MRPVNVRDGLGFKPAIISIKQEMDACILQVVERPRPRKRPDPPTDEGQLAGFG